MAKQSRSDDPSHDHDWTAQQESSSASTPAAAPRHPLSVWDPSFTTRLLKPINTRSSVSKEESDDDEVIVLDCVMSSCSDDDDVSFCANLYEELQTTKVLDRLKPARTAGESQTEELLQLLLERGMSQNSSTDSNGNPVTIRGDKSLFVAREYRHGKHRRDFETNHPRLYQLIETLSKTFQNQVEDFNDKDNQGIQYHLDLSMTSVQIAVYPGDGKSGYVRHCDRGQDYCRQETTTQIMKNTTPERLLTAVYYLTDQDWNADLDGGALRVFHKTMRKKNNQDGDMDNGNVSSHGDGSYTDILPYRDRLVVFRSDRVEHEVMPSLRRSRTAITIWFYGTVSSSIDTISKTNSTLSSASLPPPLPIVSPPVQTSRQQTLPKIFVSIASYRDSETSPTLDSLFATARYPDRVVCGVVLQLEPESPYDEDIWKQIMSHPRRAQHIRYIRLDARDAMGPCYARGLVQTLFRGEDYVLQIDSHMRFRPNWDEYLVQQVEDICRSTDSHKIMLTTYPTGYTLPNTIPHNEVRGTYLVPWKFDAQGMLRQRGRLMAADSNSEQSFDSLLPPRHYLFAGGFNFAPSRVLHDVPYDTMGLPHLFFGEELSMAVRLFTHGYNLYAPKETVCYHLWSRAHRPTPATQKRREARKEQQKATSQSTVKKQLQGDVSMIGETFGLGKDRTVSEFAEHLGVDFSTQQFVREGWEYGDLSKDNFVISDDPNGAVFPEDSFQAKIASLDSKSKALIGKFLQGIDL